MSPTLKSIGVDHFRAKFGEEGVDRCKPHFNAFWERQGVVVSKTNRVDIFYRLSIVHEHDRQTDRQTNHGTVTSTVIGEIAVFQVNIWPIVSQLSVTVGGLL